MKNVKNISIKNFLSKQEILPRQERTGYGMYLSPFRMETMPSFKVDYNANLWYDFGTGEGGSIIDLVMKLDGSTADEAIAKLENGNSFSFHRTEAMQSTRLLQSTLQISSIKPLQDSCLINYLQYKRAINPDIAREYCREVHYTTGSKSFFAIGFQSNAGGWELRNEYFKGSTSPKSPTTIGNGSSTGLLFEGFIDMLSYLTLKNAIRPSVDMVVLNSVHNLHRAEEFLKHHHTIHCFLDNDESGKRTFAEVEKLAPEVIDQSPFYRQHKDLNEFLQSHKIENKIANRHDSKVDNEPPKPKRGFRL